MGGWGEGTGEDLLSSEIETFNQPDGNRVPHSSNLKPLCKLSPDKDIGKRCGEDRVKTKKDSENTRRRLNEDGEKMDIY